MKRILKFALPVVAGACVWLAAAADGQTSQAMQSKLLYSKALFEALVTENHEQIAENAGKLHALSQSADWRIRQTTEYQRFTREFARQTTAIETAAENKNIDGATLAYFQMTMSCVNCHRYMRGSEQAKLDLDQIDDKLLASLTL